MFAATGSERLSKGRRLFARAVQIVETGGSIAEATGAINDAVRTLRSSMNWLEDTDQFEVAHQLLDQAGAFRRTHFPEQCQLTIRTQGYAQTCPVALAHNRVGLSPALIVRSAECSICRLDPEDCAHVTGRTYGGEICHRIITRADLIEVSLVGRPAQPDARFELVSVDNAYLRKQLGPRFHLGDPVLCDRCMTPCDGVSRPFEDD